MGHALNAGMVVQVLSRQRKRRRSTQPLTQRKVCTLLPGPLPIPPPPCLSSSCQPGSPAAVLPVGVQRCLSPAEAQAGEGVVQGQCHVTEAVDAIRLIIDILPVGAEPRGARGVVPIQVIVQLTDDLLIHHGFELSGKEGGPGCLLCSKDKKISISRWGVCVWGRRGWVVEGGGWEKGSAASLPASVLSVLLCYMKTIPRVLGWTELMLVRHLGPEWASGKHHVC